MKVIAFGNLKGGVGKTTMSYNIAGHLAYNNKRVLVIDGDAQGNISDNCRFDTNGDDYISIIDVFEGRATLSEAISESPMLEIPNIDIIPSNESLSFVEPKDELVISRLFKQEYNYLQEKYDYIIIDLAPSLGMVTKNLLAIADEIIIVSDTGKNAYKGINLIIKEWSKVAEDLNIPNNLGGIIVNKLENTKNVSRGYLDFIGKNKALRRFVFRNCIVNNVRLQETEVMCTPISYYDRGNKGYLSFKALMDELEELEVF